MNKEENVREILDEFVNNELNRSLEIYEKEIFPTEHSIFKELHEIMVDKKEDHNCIGCNLDEYTMLIYSTLLIVGSYTSLEQRMKMLLMTMYLLVERIDTILGIISLHEKYRKDSFKTLNKIRKWANFIKHPKAFILAHHPIYTIEGFKYNPEFRKESKEIIDNSFVF